jgi:hypothetical protein
VCCRQDDVQGTVAQEVEEEVEEFESIEKLDQLGINRGASTLPQSLIPSHRTCLRAPKAFPLV